ncbi:MAG TPA: hypothetical protein VHM25_22230 [Polyangiaceae bacterium]|jgi:hypothetical protein|nr:hypothetical protein [Polyangiaceae bacterium]
MNCRGAASLALILTTFSGSICFAQVPIEGSKETSRAEVEGCVAQHDSARQLRLGEQWDDARAAMLSCAEERCPLAIAADCRAWLDELAQQMPTLIIVIEGELQPSALRVELDGANVELKDPPSPIDSWPGAHRLRFELPGESPVVVNFSLRKGEKNHIERVRFARPPAQPATSPARIPTRPVPTSTYWLSGGAMVAFATSTAFLVSGLNEHGDARDICAPNCDPRIRSSIQARLLVADIAGGAGLVLGGLAIYTYLKRPVVFKEPPPSGPALSATREGFSLTWRGQF